MWKSEKMSELGTKRSKTDFDRLLLGKKNNAKKYYIFKFKTKSFLSLHQEVIYQAVPHPSQFELSQYYL